MAMLEVKNIGISFGGLKAVDDFSITIEKGQLYGLIGPNGAGKTTVFNLLTGVYKPDTGSILLDGRNITGKRTIDINQAGKMCIRDSLCGGSEGPEDRRVYPEPVHEPCVPRLYKP